MRSEKARLRNQIQHLKLQYEEINRQHWDLIESLSEYEPIADLVYDQLAEFVKEEFAVWKHIWMLRGQLHATQK